MMKAWYLMRSIIFITALVVPATMLLNFITTLLITITCIVIATTSSIILINLFGTRQVFTITLNEFSNSLYISWAVRHVSVR